MLQGGIVLSRILVVMLACFAVGAVIMGLANVGLSGDVRRQRWLKFLTYLAIVLLVMGCAALGRPWFPRRVEIKVETRYVETPRRDERRINVPTEPFAKMRG